MKNNHHLFLLALLCVPFLSAVPDLVITTVCEPIGPFEMGDENVSYSWSYKSNQPLKSARERLSVGFTSDNYSYFNTTAAHSVLRNRVNEITFNIPIHDYLGKDGLACKIEILISGSEPIQTFNFTIKPISKQTIIVKDYLREYYEVYDLIVDPDNDIRIPSERYRFSGFIDYFNVDYYYRLDLSYLSIEYEAMKEFPISSGYLHFKDYSRIFPLLDIEGKIPYFDIPITTSFNNGIITINYAKTMYVNQKTLEMSLDPGVDLVPTNYFYLPINRCSDLLDQIFTIKFDSFGMNKNKFSWDMRYTNDRDLIGDCRNSEYCVDGEIVA